MIEKITQMLQGSLPLSARLVQDAGALRGLAKSVSRLVDANSPKLLGNLANVLEGFAHAARHSPSAAQALEHSKRFQSFLGFLRTNVSNLSAFVRHGGQQLSTIDKVILLNLKPLQQKLSTVEVAIPSKPPVSPQISKVTRSIGSLPKPSILGVLLLLFEGNDFYQTLNDPNSDSTEQALSGATAAFTGLAVFSGVGTVGALGAEYFKGVARKDRVADLLYPCLLKKDLEEFRTIALCFHESIGPAMVPLMKRVSEGSDGVKQLFADKRHWEGREMKSLLEKMIQELLGGLLPYASDQQMASALYLAALHSPEMLRQIREGRFGGVVPDLSDWEELDILCKKMSVDPQKFFPPNTAAAMKDAVARNQTVLDKMRGWGWF